MELLFLTLGVVIGSIITATIKRNRTTFGTLEIDMTGSTPYYRLLMSNEDFEKIPGRKTVEFRVNKNAQFTREKPVL